MSRPYRPGRGRTSAEDELGGRAQRGGVPGDEQRGDDRLAPGLEVIADLLARADQRQLLDQRGRYLGAGLVLLAAEVEVLDLGDLLLVAHADRNVGVEVGAFGS